jgi:hypothetical protein
MQGNGLKPKYHNHSESSFEIYCTDSDESDFNQRVIGVRNTDISFEFSASDDPLVLLF